MERKKIKLNTSMNAGSLKWMIAMIPLGMIMIVLALSPYIKVYLLPDIQRTQAVVEQTYNQPTEDGGSTREVAYRFTADGQEYTGFEACMKNYEKGRTVSVYYDSKHPENNGLLKVHILFLGMGIFAVGFSGIGLIRFLKTKR